MKYNEIENEILKKLREEDRIEINPQTKKKFLGIVVIIIFLVGYIIFNVVNVPKFADIRFENNDNFLTFGKDHRMSYYNVAGNYMYEDCKYYNYNQLRKEIVVKCKRYDADKKIIKYNEIFKIIEYKKGSHLILEEDGKRITFNVMNN